MRLTTNQAFVQWTLADAGPPIPIFANMWKDTPTRPEPARSPIRVLGAQDNQPGYVFSITIGGKVFAGYDHYYIEDLETTLGCTRIIVWNDDPDDRPIGTRRAEMWDWYPPGPDATKRGAINTRWRATVYEEDPSRLMLTPTSPDGVPYKMHVWADFVPPTTNIRHGIWVNEQALAAHQTQLQTHQETVGWRSYSAHLPDDEVDETGRIKAQRSQGRYAPSPYTITWYWTTGSRAVGYVAANQEMALERSVGAGSITVTVSANAGWEAGLTLTTPAGDPNNIIWMESATTPSAIYRCQVDISSIGTATIESSAGSGGRPQYYRISSDLGTINGLGSNTTPTADVSATGITLFSTDLFALYPAMADDDVYSVRLGFNNSDMKNPTSVVFTCNADAFVDGPFYDGATTMYLSAATASCARGRNDNNLVGNAVAWRALEFSPISGSGSGETVVAASVAGPTNGIEPGTPAREWLSPPLAANVTISGSILAGIIGTEASSPANATVGVAIWRVDKEGVIVSMIGSGSDGAELTTTPAAYYWTINPVSTSMTKGERIRTVVYFTDATGLTMGGVHDLTLTFGGSPGVVLGGWGARSCVQFAETLTFMSAPEGTIIYPTTTTSDIADQGAGISELKAWTSRGTG